MIRITPAPEPQDFYKKVKEDGLAFLAKDPKPKSWDNKDYWGKIKPDLRAAYDGICCYLACWIAPQEIDTVEHFLPKKHYPHLAYEWSNYRYCSVRYNGCKSNYMDVIDPFEIQNGWLELDFVTRLVRVGASAPRDKITLLTSTIERLKLNHFQTSIKAREHWIKLFVKTNDLNWLADFAPFIAFELKRQNISAQELDLTITEHPLTA